METQNHTSPAGALILHPEVHQAERNGKRVKLRKKEFQLLEFLSKNKNKILNRNTLLEYVWNYNVQSKTNTLEVHISTLRQKIDDYPAKILQTIHGLGYKFCDAPDLSNSSSKQREVTKNKT